MGYGGCPGEGDRCPRLPFPGVSQAAISTRIKPQTESPGHPRFKLWYVAGRPTWSISVIWGRGQGARSTPQTLGE